MKSGAEHLAFARKGIAPQPCAFTAAKRKGTDVIQLFAQLAFRRSNRASGMCLDRLIRLKLTCVSACCGKPTDTSNSLLEIRIDSGIRTIGRSSHLWFQTRLAMSTWLKLP